MRPASPVALPRHVQAATSASKISSAQASKSEMPALLNNIKQAAIAIAGCSLRLMSRYYDNFAIEAFCSVLSAARAVCLVKGCVSHCAALKRCPRLAAGCARAGAGCQSFSVCLWLAFVVMWQPLLCIVCLWIIVVRIAARCFLHETARCRLE